MQESQPPSDVEVAEAPPIFGICIKCGAVHTLPELKSGPCEACLEKRIPGAILGVVVPTTELFSMCGKAIQASGSVPPMMIAAMSSLQAVINEYLKVEDSDADETL